MTADRVPPLEGSTPGLRPKGHSAGTWDLWLPTTRRQPADSAEGRCPDRRCGRTRCAHHELWGAACAKLEGAWPLSLSLRMYTLNLDSGVSSHASFKRLGFQTHGLFSTQQPARPCVCPCAGVGAGEAARIAAERCLRTPRYAALTSVQPGCCACVRAELSVPSEPRA